MVERLMLVVHHDSVINGGTLDGLTVALEVRCPVACRLLVGSLQALTFFVVTFRRGKAYLAVARLWAAMIYHHDEGRDKSHIKNLQLVLNT